MEDAINWVTAFADGLLTELLNEHWAEAARAFLATDDGMRLAAIVAVALGLGVFAGALTSRPGGAPGGATAQQNTADAAPKVDPKTAALEAFARVLADKGQPAEAHAELSREFLERLGDLKDKLLTLKCADPTSAGMAQEARAVLDRGELRRAVNLLYGAGEGDAAVAAEKTAEAKEHRVTAALALALAGDLEMVQFEFATAAECYRRALDTPDEAAPEFVAEYTDRLAAAAFRAGDHAAAEAAFAKTLETMEATLGPNYADLASALNNLALVHYSQDRYDDAEPLYRRALAIDEKALGKDHASVATDLNNLGVLYKKQERFKDAEPMFKRALAIKEKIFEPGHPGLVNGFRTYASLLRSMDRIKEAEAMEGRAQAMETPPEEEKKAEEKAEAII
jgi:tetratricopeptide (TPR) repeat protein